jgi:hypothetical protein
MLHCCVCQKELKPSSSKRFDYSYSVSTNGGICQDCAAISCEVCSQSAARAKGLYGRICPACGASNLMPIQSGLERSGDDIYSSAVPGVKSPSTLPDYMRLLHESDHESIIDRFFTK